MLLELKPGDQGRALETYPLNTILYKKNVLSLFDLFVGSKACYGNLVVVRGQFRGGDSLLTTCGSQNETWVCTFPH